MLSWSGYAAPGDHRESVERRGSEPAFRVDRQPGFAAAAEDVLEVQVTVQHGRCLVVGEMLDRLAGPVKRPARQSAWMRGDLVVSCACHPCMV